ncbi:hypothetical protein RJ641_025105 [Dillenia turbinata]|uniref:Uncharacterized protein n=1 Tax=Dillenia turbinata TaxID=194707 RepID=A0AAN8W074_9MAGN
MLLTSCSSFMLCVFFNCHFMTKLAPTIQGCGIQSTFIMDAASELPMLRSLSLDLCDASDGRLDMPEFDDSSVLNTVKIARCKQSRKTYGRPIHRETMVEVWNSKGHVSAVLDERV